MEMKHPIVLALHLGAGYHDKNSTQHIGLQLLSNGEDGNLVLTEILCDLENSPLTNAGYNSNLNLEGELEFDASIMEGENGLWGSVGSITGIKNPIHVANLLLKQQEKALLMNSGIVQPCILAGGQASKWAYSQGVEYVKSKSMITKKSEREYRKAHEKFVASLPQQSQSYDNFNHIIPLEELGNPSYLDGNEEVDDDDEIHVGQILSPSSQYLNLGTIGAVCIDSRGTFHAGVSSGGSILKIPGRIGHAAMYGCGCWAQNPSVSNQWTGTAISTTGCGEQLIKVLMAKTTSDCIKATQNPCAGLSQALQQFLDSGKEAPSFSSRLGGVLSITSFPPPTPPTTITTTMEGGGNRSNRDGLCCNPNPAAPIHTIELAWGHTCRSFVLCYGHNKVGPGGTYPPTPKPRVEFLEQPEKNCGQCITSGGKIIHL